MLWVFTSAIFFFSLSVGLSWRCLALAATASCRPKEGQSRSREEHTFVCMCSLQFDDKTVPVIE